jgi:hypothetical protein
MPKKYYSSSKTKTLPSNRLFPSPVKFPIKLLDDPKVVEEYDIPISRLFNPATVGNDKDLRLAGYTLLFIAATGNKIDTVGLNLSHAGPWVRRGPEDNFNQQFDKLRTFRNNRVFFSKKKLPQSESNYLNPQTDGADKDSTCRIVLKVEDIVGVLKGDTLVCSARPIFEMPHTPTLVVGADSPPGNSYQPQFISTVTIRDAVLPLSIHLKNTSNSNYVTQDTSSPYVYQDRGGGGSFTILEASPSVRFSGTAQFQTRDDATDLNYSPQGYSGTITHNP